MDIRLIVYLFFGIFSMSAGGVQRGDCARALMHFGTGSGVGGGEILSARFKEIVARALGDLQDINGVSCLA
jgi:hypothetical protein